MFVSELCTLLIIRRLTLKFYFTIRNVFLRHNKHLNDSENEQNPVPFKFMGDLNVAYRTLILSYYKSPISNIKNA